MQKSGIRLQTPMITRRRILKTLAGIAATFLPAAKLFGFYSSLKLAVDTSWRLLRNIPKNEWQKSVQGTTLLTFSVYPDLSRIWHYFAKKMFGSDIEIMVVDCCGLLRKDHFPGSQVVRFWNFSHSRKIDYFIRYVVRSRYIWLCDDDVIFVNPDSFEAARSLLDQQAVVAVSLAPRGWHLTVNDQKHRGMGSYCLLFDRDILISEELSFSPVKTDDPNVGRISGYYDTADYANKSLLERGYKIEFLLGQNECEYVCGFVGTSTAFISLLRGRQAVLDELSSMTPQIQAYRLVGYYCDWLVVKLYRDLFGEEPSWVPPLSEQEILDLVEQLDGEFRENALGQVHRYIAHYQRILSSIR